MGVFIMKQFRTTALLCAALLTAACAVPAMPAPSAFAEELTAGGFRYEETDGSVRVTGLTCERDEAPASLTIPKTIEGKPVTEIGYGAFRGYSIREILLHDGITKIGMSAFSSSAIEEIRIPDSVTSLGFNALSNCKKLKSVVLPKNLEYVPRGLCSGCESLEQITLPENVQEISPNAFNACTALKSFQIPESVVTIGYEAFADCSALSSIKIPDTAKAIGNNAFAGTPWIEAKRKISPFVCSDSGKVLLDGKACTGDIVIPDTVERINEEAFSKNNDLTGVTIPESVTEFGAAVFAECDALKHVVLLPDIRQILAAQERLQRSLGVSVEILVGIAQQRAAAPLLHRQFSGLLHKTVPLFRAHRLPGRAAVGGGGIVAASGAGKAARGQLHPAAGTDHK